MHFKPIYRQSILENKEEMSFSYVDSKRKFHITDNEVSNEQNILKSNKIEEETNILEENSPHLQEDEDEEEL